MSVCVRVCHTCCSCQFQVFVFFHKIYGVCIVLRILNLEGHQNCITGSNGMTILMMFLILLIRSWESRCACWFSRGRSVTVAVGQVAGDMLHNTFDMWHLTCDSIHLTCDTRHATRDTWGDFYLIYHFYKKCSKVSKRQKICQKCNKWLKSVKNEEFNSNGANIRTSQGSQYFKYIYIYIFISLYFFWVWFL